MSSDADTLWVIDAGVGNLGNLVRALRHVGADARLTTEPGTVAAARRLVLPGVGAFRPPREALRGAHEDALRGALDDGSWLLGICVGYQLLFESSSEFGQTDGLALLPGRIEPLPEGVPLPHIGWNPLRGVQEHPLLDGVPEGAHVYFVHSFAPAYDPEAPQDHVLAHAVHGVPFAAIAGRDRVLGTQFHPEKSGRHGLRLLSNFVEMSR